MSDELEQILNQTPTRPASPRSVVGPRVRGGPLLQGMPKLENDHPQQDQSSPPRTLHAPPASKTVGESPPPGGPHSPLAASPDDSLDRADRESSRIIPHETLAQPLPDAAPDSQLPPSQLSAINLHKAYRKGPVMIPVLNGVNLSVQKGEFLAVTGSSGSGKSTLLHILGTLDSPDSGEVRLDGYRIDNLRGASRNALRNEYFGMIFQFYHLLPELTTLENVLTPLMIGESVFSYWRHRHRYHRIARRTLEMVNLGHRMRHKPCELSGGEMQRAAIARALVTGPELLLADEPTGNLDHASGRQILQILGSLNQQRNLTIVMVTHDQAIAQEADRIVRLVDGRVEEV